MNSRNHKSSWAGELQKKGRYLIEKLTYPQNLPSILFHLQLIDLCVKKRKNIFFNVK